MFNQYSLYSYVANDFVNSCDDKVIVDLNRLNVMNDFDEISDYIKNKFADFEKEIALNYPNDVTVSMIKDESRIFVIAMQNDKAIFCKGWEKVVVGQAEPDNN